MSTVNQLRSYVRDFTLCPALGEVGKLSKDLFSGNAAYRNVKVGQSGRQTVTQWGLAFAAWQLIESSNDARRHTFHILNILKASHIYAELEDPLLRDRNSFGCFFGTLRPSFLHILSTLLWFTLQPSWFKGAVILR